MQKSSTEKSVENKTVRSANVIPSEESAELLENNLSDQIKIVRLLQEVLKMETLKLKRMLKERLLDSKEEGRFGKYLNLKKE